MIGISLLILTLITSGMGLLVFVTTSVYMSCKDMMGNMWPTSREAGYGLGSMYLVSVHGYAMYT